MLKVRINFSSFIFRALSNCEIDGLSALNRMDGLIGLAREQMKILMYDKMSTRSMSAFLIFFDVLMISGALKICKKVVKIAVSIFSATNVFFLSKCRCAR